MFTAAAATSTATRSRSAGSASVQTAPYPAILGSTNTNANATAAAPAAAATRRPRLPFVNALCSTVTTIYGPTDRQREPVSRRPSPCGSPSLSVAAELMQHGPQSGAGVRPEMPPDPSLPAPPAPTTPRLGGFTPKSPLALPGFEDNRKPCKNGGVRRPAIRDPRSLILGGWIVVVLATEAWPSWESGIRDLFAHDVASYQAIAEAAPGLPSAPVVPATPGQPSFPERRLRQRFPVHWSVGRRFLAHCHEPRGRLPGRVVLCFLAILLVMHRCSQPWRSGPGRIAVPGDSCRERLPDAG